MRAKFANARAVWLVIGCVIGLVVGGGAALAAVPASDATITACYGPLAGYTRIIDVAKGEKCTSAEKKLTWNQTGPAGPAGKDGLNGTNGTNGKDGAPGKDGLNGTNGLDGKDGKDGLNGKDGTNGTDGAPGAQGPAGEQGPQGLPGQPGSGLGSFDDLVGMTCRVGTPQEGVLAVSYDATGVATLNCGAATLYTLTVTNTGQGSGTVTSSPAGISCQSTCSAAYPAAAQITLTRTVGANSAFKGWSGACSGTAATCTVTMDADTSVGAQFAPTTRVFPAINNDPDANPFTSFGTTEIRLGGTGGTTVCSQTGPGARACNAVNVEVGSSVTFTAVGNGDRFEQWDNGPCSGSTSNVCTFTPTSTAQISLQARFSDG